MTKLNLELATLQKLKKLIGTNCYEFLGYTLDLNKSNITDNLPELNMNLSEWTTQIFTTLLCHYSLANPITQTGTLVKYKDLPGGYAYENAFIKRAIEPIAEIFGEKPKELLKLQICSAEQSWLLEMPPLKS